ncbi:MAG: right-handed parallel beta-helix repeat-containing protein, partial [Acidimicrobiales bacterium]
MPTPDEGRDRAAPARKRKFATLALLCLISLVGALLYSVPSAQAQRFTVYVAPGGSDSNPGTRARPKATIVAAMQALPQGGEILMRGGTYRIANRSGAMWMGGTAQRPLVVKSAPGERARLVSAPDNHCILALGDYTQIRNITCTGYNGIMAYDANHIRIVGNHVHD